jgi:hypothetical protein
MGDVVLLNEGSLIPITAQRSGKDKQVRVVTICTASVKRPVVKVALLLVAESRVSYYVVAGGMLG